MSDWQEASLADLAEYINGRAIKPEECSTQQGIPVIRIKQINDPQSIEDRFCGDDLEEKNIARSGDLLFSWSATLKTILWQGPTGAINQHIFKVLPKEGIDKTFLHYLIDHSIPALTEESHGSTMKHIKKSALSAFHLQIPPLPEQKKIAEILSGIDKAISTKKQARNDLEAAREAICGELIQNGDWSQEEIGNLTSHMTNGFVGTATPHYRERGIKYLTSKNIRRDRIDTNRMIYISEEFHMANQKSSLRVGDVLMVQSGHIGTTAVVTNDYKDCNCHALILMRFNQEHLHPEYASLYLNSATGKTRLSDIFVGSTIKHVNTGDLRKFKIPVPPLDVQRDIANRVRSIDILLGTRDLQIEKLVILKQAISSDLLSGRKRVSV